MWSSPNWSHASNLHLIFSTWSLQSIPTTPALTTSVVTVTPCRNFSVNTPVLWKPKFKLQSWEGWTDRTDLNSCFAISRLGVPKQIMYPHWGCFSSKILGPKLHRSSWGYAVASATTTTGWTRGCSGRTLWASHWDSCFLFSISFHPASVHSLCTGHHSVAWVFFFLFSKWNTVGRNCDNTREWRCLVQSKFSLMLLWLLLSITHCKSWIGIIKPRMSQVCPSPSS